MKNIKCPICKKTMRRGVGCDYQLIQINGKVYPRSAYHSGLDNNFVGEYCHDCGVKEGQIHHWGCDVEVCPRCGKQLISCNCKKQRVGRLEERMRA
ncbi:MAG: hypothetical protein QW478_05170 [Candidatus Micrarchaeaceae archaeon]